MIGLHYILGLLSRTKVRSLSLLIFSVITFFVAFKIMYPNDCPDMSHVPFQTGMRYTSFTPFGVNVGSTKRQVFEVLVSRWRRHYEISLEWQVPMPRQFATPRNLSEEDWRHLERKDNWLLVRCGTHWKFVELVFEDGQLSAVRDEERYGVP